MYWYTVCSSVGNVTLNDMKHVTRKISKRGQQKVLFLSKAKFVPALPCFSRSLSNLAQQRPTQRQAECLCRSSSSHCMSSAVSRPIYYAVYRPCLLMFAHYPPFVLICSFFSRDVLRAWSLNSSLHAPRNLTIIDDHCLHIS